MKVIVFVKNGRPCADDMVVRESLRAKSHKAYFSNGSIKHGFEDSCDAVYLTDDFPHIEKWAVSKGIEVMNPTNQTTVEVKQDAGSHSERTEEETQADEEVKPKRRGRRSSSTE